MTIQPILAKLDKFQQKKPITALPVAVVKSYSQDKAGLQAALITYYGFLSLFPLLMIATSIASIVIKDRLALQQNLVASINEIFPVIGDQLTKNINASAQSGVALFIGLLIAFYGARGGADAFRNAVYHIWNVPDKQRTAFPKSVLSSMAMMLIGAVGFYLSVVLASKVPGLLSPLISLVVLIGTFYFLYSICLGRRVATVEDKLRMSLTTSIGIVAVQQLGNYLLTSQLNKLTPLYGTFALVLGLLFWIYLQAVIVLYCLETKVVIKYKRWPVSLFGKSASVR